MELILVRHALPVRIEGADGPADPPLSVEGHAQARHMAEYLALETVDALYASPMRRAVQTAEPLAELLSLEIAIEDDVAEFDQFSPEYVPVEQLKAENDPRFLELLEERQHDADEFAGRVLPALDRIIDGHPGQRVAVVCHGGVINVFLSAVLGLDIEGPGFFYPNYTSIHRVAASRSGVRSIVTVNETAHLRTSGLPMGLFQKSI